MVDITLLEVDLDDATFTANAPYSGNSDPAEESNPGDDDGGLGSGERAGPGGKVLAMLVVLAIAGLALWRMRSTSEQGATEEIAAGD
jgi:hypothetical protein